MHLGRKELLSLPLLHCSLTVLKHLEFLLHFFPLLLMQEHLYWTACSSTQDNSPDCTTLLAPWLFRPAEDQKDSLDRFPVVFLAVCPRPCGHPACVGSTWDPSCAGRDNVLHWVLALKDMGFSPGCACLKACNHPGNSQQSTQTSQCRHYHWEVQNLLSHWSVFVIYAGIILIFMEISESISTAYSLWAGPLGVLFFSHFTKKRQFNSFLLPASLWFYMQWCFVYSVLKISC